MCRGLLPPATYLVAIKPVPEVSPVTALHVVPPVLGGLALVRGGGAGSLGSLILVIRGDHGEAILHEELVVVRQSELGEPGGSNPYNEGGEVPSLGLT